MNRFESLRIPIKPDELLDSLIYSELAKGNIRLNIDSFSVSIPAKGVIAGTNSHLINVPSGNVGLIYKMHEIVSDMYTPELRMNFVIDSARNTQLDTTIKLDKLKDFSITYYQPAKLTMGWSFFNDTANIINVSGTVQIIYMNIGFYETWYRPLLNHSYSVLNDLAEELRKKGR